MTLSFRQISTATILLLAIEILSYLGFLFPGLGMVMWFAIVITVGLASWRNLETGLLILLAETFIGGKGYLFSLTVGPARISIRIAIFIVVLVVWFFRHRGEGNPFTRIPAAVRPWLIGLAGAIGWGILAGWLGQRGLEAVFFDANAFLFFGLTPVLFSPALNWSRLGSAIVGLVAAATIILGVKSLLSLGLFAHLEPNQLTEYYRWVRTTGVGEIAYINGNAYRVFFQSQIFALFGIAILTPLLWPRLGLHRDWRILVPITLGITAVMISLSRSFWVGAAVAAIGALTLMWKRFDWTFSRVAIAIGVATVSLGTAYTLTSWALHFPYPFPPSKESETAKLIGRRFETLGGEAAASSRLNQLQPLWEGIRQHPLIGSGFGTPLTYQSNDPRQLTSATGGRYTTYAFEWGYLDLVLKIGIVGLICYLGVLWTILRRLWQASTPIAFGWMLTILSLAAIHITTPYLNHPIGIAAVLLGLVFGSREWRERQV